MSVDVILRDEDGDPHVYTVTEGVRLDKQGGGTQDFYLTSGKKMLTDTTAVDVKGFAEAQIDAANIPNLSAGNIKKDVQILGVTGSYEGSGTGDANYRAMINRTITTVTAADITAAGGLGPYAFAGCEYLTSVVLPNDITEIPSGCFLYARILNDYVLVIPTSVTDIYDKGLSGKFIINIDLTQSINVGAGAFACASFYNPNIVFGGIIGNGEYVFSLSDVVSFAENSNSAIYTYEKIFNLCLGLTSVDLNLSNAEGFAEVADMRGAFCGCYSLTSITLRNVTAVPLADSTTFTDSVLGYRVPSNCIISVPANMVSAFQADQYFGAYTIQAIA